MKIAILCNSIEWTEKQLLKILNRRGHHPSFFKVGDEEIFESGLVLNRCMPSAAAKDPDFSLRDYLKVIEKAVKMGIPVVNDGMATYCDFNKFISAVTMLAQQVRTPETIIATNAEEALKTANEFLKYPVIKKPSMNGRSIGVKLIETRDQLAAEEDWDPPHGFMVMQKFLMCIEPHDYRVYLCDGVLMFGHKRTLVDGWLGSPYKGSELKPLHNADIPIDVIAEATLASKTINAWFNSCDVIMTKDGPYIIENDPTPNFTAEHIPLYEFNPVEVLVNRIEDKWLS